MLIVHTRGNIAHMDNIIHGANPEKLYNTFNIPIPGKIIDFSTNTNILSWPEIKIDVASLASHYPDNDCTRLRQTISKRENIDPSRILFTNGINEAIFILSRLYGDDTAILQPCYSEYSRAFRNAGNIFGLEDAGRFRHVIICNPNNPTGQYIPELSNVIAACPYTMFIIDEAYIDFLMNYEPERLWDFPNVIILRSLTKIFHLSGVRIGYVIANENVIAGMKECQPSWSVNAFAQELALHFLNDEAFYEATHNFYRKNTPVFMESLRRSGFEVMSSDVHYFLVKVHNDMEIIRYLLGKGIVVRHTRNFAGLNGKYVRVATLLPEHNEKFITELKQYDEL